MKISYGLKGGLGPMFIRVVTVSRMEILGSIIHREISEMRKEARGRSGSGLRIGQIYSDLLRCGTVPDTTISKLGDFNMITEVMELPNPPRARCRSGFSSFLPPGDRGFSRNNP